MEVMKNRTFDEERALYGSKGIYVKDCAFDGPADGESAFKEAQDIRVENVFFNLRYPFWHDDRVKIEGAELTSLITSRYQNLNWGSVWKKTGIRLP